MEIRYYEHICNNIENVENYDKALADDFEGWHCHHRLETHNSDGERRLVDITKKELIALDMYYHRPAEELIFLTTKEHHHLHHKGKPSGMKDKHQSEETCRKISKANKGEKNGFYGKHHSKETLEKIKATKEKNGTLHKGTFEGHKHSDEAKKKIREARRKYFENGGVSPMKGKHISEEVLKRRSETVKGKHWYNNGTKNIWSKTCPEGFVPGRLLKENNK